MSNGLSSLGTSASINAANAWSTKVDVAKRSTEIAWEAINDRITDILETREDIYESSSAESMMDWVLKPIGAVVGFLVGGPAGAAIGWSGVDFLTDIASPAPNITPKTREGVDLKSKYSKTRPGGGDFAGDVMDYIQEGYNIFTLGSAFAKTGVGKELSRSWAGDTVAPTTPDIPDTPDTPAVSDVSGETLDRQLMFQGQTDPKKVGLAGGKIETERSLYDVFTREFSKYQKKPSSGYVSHNPYSGYAYENLFKVYDDIYDPLQQIIAQEKSLFMEDYTR